MRRLNLISSALLLANLLTADPCSAPNCCPPGALNAPSCSCKQYEGVFRKLFPSTPCLDCPCDPCSIIWTADVSVLAWQAIEEGLDFALENNPLPISSTTNVNGSLVGIDFNWEPAVKVNLGFEIPSRSWNANVRWTYFHTRSSHTANLETNVDSTGLLPLWAFPNANIATQFLYGKAEGVWQLNLNAVDVEMGYSPFLSPALALRFIAGVKVVSLDQHFHVAYSEGFSDGIDTLLSAKTTLNNEAMGTGPRIGFDSKWHVGKGFSLLGSIAGSLPLYHYRINRTDADLGFNTTVLEKTVGSFFKQAFWTFRPVLETSIGLGWDTCFGCRSQYPFGFNASYEFQYLAEQNMMAMLVNPGVQNLAFEPRGDLHLHGATFTFHFGY